MPVACLMIAALAAAAKTAQQSDRRADYTLSLKPRHVGGACASAQAPSAKPPAWCWWMACDKLTRHAWRGAVLLHWATRCAHAGRAWSLRAWLLLNFGVALV